MKLEKSCDLFLQKCNAKNLSINTIEYYRMNLHSFFKFLHRQGITEIEQVTIPTIYEYFSYITEKYSSITVKGRYITLQTFMKFLLQIKVIYDNPILALEKPKVEKRIIYSFTKDEVQEILNIYDKDDFIGLRNYTIMNVLFGTGIRKSELINITVFDLDLASGTMHIIGKGNKERIVPLGTKLRTILRTYLKQRGNYLNKRDVYNNNRLFITKDGKPITSSGFTTIFQTLKERKAHWSTRVSAHTFRHTFAKFFLLNGGDLFMLQKILGHEDISITRMYVDYNEHEMLIQNAKFNPLDNTRWRYS